MSSLRHNPIAVISSLYHELHKIHDNDDDVRSLVQNLIRNGDVTNYGNRESCCLLCSLPLNFKNEISLLGDDLFHS